MDDFITIERAPRQASDRPPLLLLLHGYGSNEHDLVGLADWLDPRFRLVSVRAPLDLDMGGHAWFGIEFTPVAMVMDVEEGFRSRDRLLEWLAGEQTRHGNDATDTFALGFSQGGAMAMSLLLAEPGRLGGVAFLSGVWVKDLLPTDEAIVEGLRGKPVLQTHGTHDPLLSITRAHNTRDVLSTLPIELTYREYPMAHEINADCLQDLGRWLTQRLPA